MGNSCSRAAAANARSIRARGTPCPSRTKKPTVVRASRTLRAAFSNPFAEPDMKAEMSMTGIVSDITAPSRT